MRAPSSSPPLLHCAGALRSCPGPASRLARAPREICLARRGGVGACAFPRLRSGVTAGHSPGTRVGQAGEDPRDSLGWAWGWGHSAGQGDNWGGMGTAGGGGVCSHGVCAGSRVGHSRGGREGGWGRKAHDQGDHGGVKEVVGHPVLTRVGCSQPPSAPHPDHPSHQPTQEQPHGPRDSPAGLLAGGGGDVQSSRASP